MPWSVLETKSKLADVGATVLVNLSSIALREAIDEPALVNIGIAAVFAVLELKNSTKSMEVLRVNQNLTLIDIVVVFANANQLQLKTIWLMNYRRSICILHVVIGHHSAMILHPVLLTGEELTRCGP